MGSLPRPSLRFLAAIAAAATALTLTFPLGAFGDTKAKLQDARDRLQALETQLASDRQAVDTLEGQLASLKQTVADAQARYQQLSVQLEQTKNDVHAAQSDYDAVKAQLDQIMADAYMGGAGSTLNFLMDARSQADLIDRLDLLSAVAQSNANLAAQATQLASNLEDKSAAIHQLLQDKARVLQALNDEKTALQEATQQHKEAVAQEQKTMNDLLDLVAQLRRRLNAEDIAKLQQAFQGSKSVPYGKWADAFLAQEINAPTCRDNEVALVAWQLNEGTSADWNPLATTYSMPGATYFNSIGVKNYVSLAQGLAATRLTLQKGASSYLYQPILANLHRCSPAMKTAQAINASAWCRGCTYGRYVTGLIDKVAANYSAYAKL